MVDNTKQVMMELIQFKMKEETVSVKGEILFNSTTKGKS